MAKRMKTGGRQKGTPNKITTKMREEAMADGETPPDLLLRIMRNARNSVRIRMEAESKAAPYVHPRLNAIEHKGALECLPGPKVEIRFVDGPQYEEIAKRLCAEV